MPYLITIRSIVIVDLNHVVGSVSPVCFCIGFVGYAPTEEYLISLLSAPKKISSVARRAPSLRARFS